MSHKRTEGRRNLTDEQIVAAVLEAHGNHNVAARKLGVRRETVNRRMQSPKCKRLHHEAAAALLDEARTMWPATVREAFSTLRDLLKSDDHQVRARVAIKVIEFAKEALPSLPMPAEQSHEADLESQVATELGKLESQLAEQGEPRRDH